MRNKIKIVSFFSVRSYAYAIHCCKAHAKINWEIENSTPCKIITHEDFNFKLSRRDYVVDITHHATFGSNRSSRGGGLPPNMGNITLLWLFCYPVLFSRSCAQVEPSHWFLRWIAQMTCFRPRMVLLGVGTMDDVIWGKYSPKTTQKGAWMAVSSQNAKMYTSQYLWNY